MVCSVRGSRLRLVGSLFATLAVVGSLTVLGGVAQAQKSDKKAEVLAEPENKTLQTKDGVPIHITYYKSLLGKEAPVIVLLHIKDGNRFVWQKGFAERLQADGYAVITVDLRGHGESKGAAASTTGNVNQTSDKDKKKPGSTGKKAGGIELKPADYEAMVALDMEAVKKFIYEENQAENLNMNKTGIVGPEMGASIAAFAAVADWNKAPHPDGQPGFQTPRGQDVRALVLISPQTSYHGLVMSKAINDLRNPAFNIAFLIGWGKGDPQDKGQAKKIYDQAAALPGSEKRMYKQEYAGKLSGTDLLGKRVGIEEHMLAFFSEHLKKLDAPWRDRQSKLDKKKS